MTGASTVFLGSAQGSGQLLAEAFGRRLRNQLRSLGVVVLDAAATRRGGGTLAAALTDEQAVVAAVAGAFRAVLVLDETEAGSGGGTTASDRVADIAAVCGEPSLQVVLTVERQDRLIEHGRMDALQAGRTAPADTSEHDHAPEVRALAALAMVSSLRVRPYELVQAGTVAFVDDALALAGLRGQLDLRALGPRGEALVAYRTYPGDEHARLLDDSVRARIVDAHRALNEAFFAEHLPELPPDSYADDAATARLADILVVPRVRPPGPVSITRTAWARAQRDLHRLLDRGE